MLFPPAKYYFNNSVSLNAFASKAATSAVIMGHSSHDVEYFVDRTLRASILSFSALRKLINAFPLFPCDSGRRVSHQLNPALDVILRNLEMHSNLYIQTRIRNL